MRKTVCRVLLMLFFCSILAGCGQKDQEEDGAKYNFYYLSQTEDSFVKKEYKPSEEVSNVMVEEIKENMEAAVKSDDYLKLLPKDVKILGCSYEGSVVTLNLNEVYQKMSNTREILVRAGIVKMFTQIPGIQSVRLLINGQEMTDFSGNPIGFLEKESFVENEGKNLNSYQYMDMELYFANKAGDRLVKTGKKVYYSSNAPLEKVIVEQLIKGPGNSNSNVQATVSPDTKILGVSIVEDICYVNLNKTFLNQTMNVQEKLPVYSIVNSLMKMCNISGVQISVEGESKVTFRESMDLNQLYQADYDLVEDSEDE